MGQKNNPEWTGILEGICSSVLTDHYEECSLVDMKKGTIKSLLPLSEQGAAPAKETGSLYEEKIRQMIEEHAVSQEDREKLATLFPDPCLRLRIGMP